MEILITSAILLASIYSAFFTRMARNTRELSRMNQIWEKFNNGIDPLEVENLLNERKWKYHKDKANLLKVFIDINKKMKQITIPKASATEPDQQVHSCGCYFEGFKSRENKAKRRECKFHREMEPQA